MFQITLKHTKKHLAFLFLAEQFGHMFNYGLHFPPECVCGFSLIHPLWWWMKHLSQTLPLVSAHICDNITLVTYQKTKNPSCALRAQRAHSFSREQQHEGLERLAGRKKKKVEWTSSSGLEKQHLLLPSTFTRYHRDKTLEQRLTEWPRASGGITEHRHTQS